MIPAVTPINRFTGIMKYNLRFTFIPHNRRIVIVMIAVKITEEIKPEKIPRILFFPAQRIALIPHPIANITVIIRGSHSMLISIFVIMTANKEVKRKDTRMPIVKGIPHFAKGDFPILSFLFMNSILRARLFIIKICDPGF